jgi:hypothetical protein
MIGASHTTGFFTGIEQRPDLVKLAKKLASDYHIRNVNFIHSNITSVNFSDYQAFYFYNSFQEYIDDRDRIDNVTKGAAALHQVYSMYLFEQFACLPAQTRLVTYCGSSNIVPSTFQLQYSLYDGFLKFWKKQ